MDVLVTNPSWVADFARNGWLVPFDETYTNILNDAGVTPIRVSITADHSRFSPIYAIPITRAADFVLYRKSLFNNQIPTEVQRVWERNVFSREFSHESSIFFDGQNLYRLFLGMVWSIEPDWPCGSNGVYVANTPAARTVLMFLKQAAADRYEVPSPTRSQHLSHMRACVNWFANRSNEKSSSGISAKPTKAPCWLMSTWVQRMLFSSRSLPPPIPLDDIGFIPLGAIANSPGYSLADGKCLVVSRRLLANNPETANVRIGIRKLVEYLLSADGQRDLCLDQFEIPVRRGVLNSMTKDDMASAFSSWRTGIDIREYRDKVKLHAVTNDTESLTVGDQVLSCLQQMEAMLDDPSVMHVRFQSPLSLHQAFLVNQMAHRVVSGSSNPLAMSPLADQEEKNGITSALLYLQSQFNAGDGFIPSEKRRLSVKEEGKP